jgi:tryptophan synthase alpha chain
MSRIDDAMAALGTRRRKALVAYLCMGDPSHEESVELAVACAEAGADMLELGVPFSDPTADGPAIAQAAERALHAGGGLSRSIDAARSIRARTHVPLLLFGYYNPIFVRGEEKTVRDARDAGVDGLLVVDLPVEEAATLRAHCKAAGLSLVLLLTPTSSPARIALARRALAECDPGFVYYVSVAGVTGAAQAPLAEAGARAAALRTELDAPVVIGFGIDSADKAALAAKQADGVVVGSALVRLVPDRAAIASLIRSLRGALGD